MFSTVNNVVAITQINTKSGTTGIAEERQDNILLPLLKLKAYEKFVANIVSTYIQYPPSEDIAAEMPVVIVT